MGGSVKQTAADSLTFGNVHLRTRLALILGPLLTPKRLKLTGHPKVNCDPNDIVIFHRLLYLYVFIAENLHLLPIVPKT